MISVGFHRCKGVQEVLWYADSFERSRHLNWILPGCAIVTLLVLSLAGKGADEPSNKPMPGQRAAETMQLPEGFRATCFASEPDVVEPIAFTFDTRGRLWVVESMAYPNWQKSGTGKDRVIILEDTDGDGVFDKRTVFLENGRNLTGIELGFGGVWLLSAPEMIFIPVKEGEDKPAGPAKVLLDGWNTEIKHNIVSNLTWGMDGWLYGCHGITLKSKVGKPGSSEADRKEFDCCIWRYHPTRAEFEVVCWGGTNPWGLDYDQYGNWFMTNCVIDHVFQVVPNAHYIRMFGSDPNPYIYHPLPGCADHKHWGGGKWTEGGRFDDNLGGHAHSGLMIYQDGNWPVEYRNELYTLSIHGKRLQREHIDYQGPVAIALHKPDTLKVKDSWFMGVQAKAGPDGGVYMIDWNDTGECHSYVNTQRTTGRIYKVTYGKPAVWKKDLSKFRDDELVALHRHAGNEWQIRQARRLLQERHRGGFKFNLNPLRAIVEDNNLPVPTRLRAFWTLHACDASPDYAKYWQPEQDSNLRSWALRLACDNTEQSCTLAIKSSSSASQSSNSMIPIVAMTMASVLPRLPDVKRWEAIELLSPEMPSLDVSREQEVQNATYAQWMLTLFWNGCEALVKPESTQLPKLLGMFKHPWHIEWATRKLCTLKGLSALDKWAQTLTDQPELTGAQRMNLDYLLENIVTPNAIVAQDYRATTFVMNNGRVITGMITKQQGGSLTIQTATEKLVINKADIESQQQTDKSLMPEGLLDQLSINEIRDLIGYLSLSQPSPSPAKRR